MKTLNIMTLAGLALAFGVSARAQAYAVNDWYVHAPNATSITNGNTSSATVNYGAVGATNAEQTYLWSYFAGNSTPVTLSNGQTLTFSASISVDFSSASSRSIADFRFGLFDSASTRATTDVASFGTTRTSSTVSGPREGWTGFYTGSVASGSGSIFRRNAGTTSVFTSSTNTASVALTSGATNQTFSDNVGVALELSLTRTGNDLSVSGSFGGSSIVGSYVDYFASGYPATFDAVGFYLGSQGTGGVATNSITISGATVTVIPEPSAFSLIAAACGTGVVCFRVARRPRRS